MSLSPAARAQVQRAQRILNEREGRRQHLREQAVSAARILADEFGAHEVWLFGSVLTGWFHEGSDLDLATCGVDPHQISAAWERVGADVDARLDLVALEDCDERLRQRILKTGERLQ